MTTPTTPRITIGIRREDIDQWERRVPLVPADVATLQQNHPIDFLVQPSAQRACSDADYLSAGARLSESLDTADFIIALKEIPPAKILPDKCYLFFSHTFKGQPANMPMLKTLLERNCTLIDYEKIVDEHGQRLHSFSNFAGLAGMIDTLWALGLRLNAEGIANPFSQLRQARHYSSLAEAKEAVRTVGTHIATHGVPPQLNPLVFAFLGYGNVSKGAQEIFDLLPFHQVSPGDLTALAANPPASDRLYKVVFREADLVAPLDPSASFDLHHFYANPHLYRSRFENYVPAISVIVNAIFWTPASPRYLTRDFMKAHYAPGTTPRLRVVGDITCDVDGALACTVKDTHMGDPLYLYDAINECATAANSGPGPLVLAVYNLPAELPVEASTAFSSKLRELIPELLQLRLDHPFDTAGLPPHLHHATFIYRGEFTPTYAYLTNHI